MAEGWAGPVFRAAPDTGPLRVNFTYRNWIGTSAGRSHKAGRLQFFEGPVEPAAFVEAEVLTEYVDVQFQPIQLTWSTGGGGFRSFTLDAAFETEAGDILFEEHKGHQAYLDDPDTKDLLDQAEKALVARGAVLRRRTGTELLAPLRRRILLDVFHDARTMFDEERDVPAVLDAIERANGVAPLGRIHEALGGSVRLANAKAHAMMVRRHIRIDLDRPPMRDTPVTVPPPPAFPGRLRAFLRRFVEGDDGQA